MNCWLTTQWPPFKDDRDNHPPGVWLRDDKKSHGENFSAGDLFLVYQTGAGDTESTPLPDGSKKLLKRQKGKNAIVAIFKIKKGAPEPEDIRYEDGTSLRWWRWPVEVLPTDGAVPLRDVKQILGYKEKYNLRGLGKGTGIIKISRDNFEKLANLLNTAKVVLTTVENADQVRESIRMFSEGAHSSQARALSLMRQTSYWVYDIEEGTFGPGKFSGYSGMDFQKYEQAIKKNFSGAHFDGGVTKNAIEAALEKNFIFDARLVDDLKKWGNGLFGIGTFERIDTSKWQFVILPASRRYWAAMANPTVYRIDDAVRDFEETPWTVKTSDVRKGDRLAIWRSKGSGDRRGIIAFAEVLSDPAEMEEIPEQLSYWLKPPESPRQRRVMIRFVKLPRLPLWCEDDTTGFLGSLSVARSQGGIFKIDPEQWRKVTEMAGGWAAGAENDLEEEIAEAVRRVQTRAGGQGFSSSPKVRKVVEKRAMDVAQEHFEREGYMVVVKGKPYDLHCTRGEETLYVEVKGTQEAGITIILTRNEVAFVKEKTPHMGLFIVHGIRVDGGPENPVASGGTKRFRKPWSIKESALSPLAFQYRVPVGTDL